jgi:hypothetical protein
MKVLLHIALVEEKKNNFHNEVLIWAKSAIPEVICFDLDNYSESLIFKYASDLTEQSEQLCVFWDVEPIDGMARFSGIIEHLFSKKHTDILMVVKGKNAMLDTMLYPFKEKVLDGMTDWKADVVEFFRI